MLYVVLIIIPKSVVLVMLERHFFHTCVALTPHLCGANGTLVWNTLHASVEETYF